MRSHPRADVGERAIDERLVDLEHGDVDALEHRRQDVRLLLGAGEQVLSLSTPIAHLSDSTAASMRAGTGTAGCGVDHFDAVGVPRVGDLLGLVGRAPGGVVAGGAEVLHRARSMSGLMYLAPAV